MLEQLKQEFDAIAEEYRTYISEKMPPEDFVEYNEILFSAHSCGIEGRKKNRIIV